jgi:Lon protease-like protein
MVDLPLFPLNSVLFPGTPIQLHIFEPRYLKMVGDCLAANSSFGVVLIRSGVEALGPLAEPHRIGCLAKIAQLERLADGRMDLTAVGLERFRVLNYDRQSQPYLVGKIQNYPIENIDPIGLQTRANQLRKQFERFIEALLSSGSTKYDLNQIPEDGVTLGFLAAAMLQISPLQKQELLTMEHANRLLDRVIYYYSRELAILNVLLSDSNHLQAGGFSTS